MKKTWFWIVTGVATLFITAAWASGFPWGSLDIIFVYQLNRLVASLGFFFFFLQFLLSSRMKLIEDGFGLDKMIRYHRNFGRAALMLLFLHPVFLFAYELQLGIASLNLFRMIGLAALLGITVTALVAAFHRKIKMAYELWLHIHKANYVLFPLAAVHVFYNATPGTAMYYTWLTLFALFVLLVGYRLWQVADIRKNPYEVVSVKQEASDIWSLSFKGRPLSFKPGQFMYLRLQRNGKLSSAHPFTISSSPTRDILSVTPKELGDFTSTIKDTRPGDQAYIDAPYGVFSFLNYDAEKLVFIAGGIGITPMMSMLRYMYDKSMNKTAVLLWGNKNEDALCFREELDTIGNALENVNLVYVMSAQKDWPGEKGRIDKALIEKYVPGTEGCRFFLCGPPPFSRAVMQALNELGVPRDRVHHELFEM